MPKLGASSSSRKGSGKLMKLRSDMLFLTGWPADTGPRSLTLQHAEQQPVVAPVAAADADLVIPRHRPVHGVPVAAAGERVRRGPPPLRLSRGEGIGYVERAALAFDPDVFTFGFARRVASYKRLNLLVADPRRALALPAARGRCRPGC